MYFWRHSSLTIILSVAAATLVPVPITFCVAAARAVTVALRAVVDDVVPFVVVAPRFTVVRPAVALRAVTFDVVGVADLALTPIFKEFNKSIFLNE